jgi:hypothetical protein
MHDSSNSPQEAMFTPVKNSWFQSRPIPVFIISAWCILQFIGVSLFIINHWQEVKELVNTGIQSPIVFIGDLFYPFIMFTAGILLLFMQKSATIAFGLYLSWGVIKVLSQDIDFPGYLSLALVFGVFVYCLRLHQTGRLK